MKYVELECEANRSIRPGRSRSLLPASVILLASMMLAGCAATDRLYFWPFWVQETEAEKRAERVPEPEPVPEVPIAVTVSAVDVATQLSESQLEDFEQRPIVHLSEVAAIFYNRLAHRRVNSIATFHDPALREFFRSSEAFADYYADLVQALDNNHFEANRPNHVGVESFAVEEGLDRVIVQVQFRGENGLPMRFWKVNYIREDTWELASGSWLIVPRRL